MTENALAERLSGGDRRSTGAADAVAGEAARDPTQISLLVALIAHADPVVRMRAADALEKATRSRPELLAPYAEAFLVTIGSGEQQEERRHVAQMLPRLPLHDSQRPQAVALLRRYLSDQSRIVVVEALTALTALAQDDPALRVWLIPELERAAAEGAPSVQARAKRLLTGLSSAPESGPHRPAITRRTETDACSSAH